MSGEIDRIKPGRLVGKQPDNEADHFFLCAACGQAVDMRDLAEVFRHEDDNHQAKRFS
jgi:hypothetical protein